MNSSTLANATTLVHHVFSGDHSGDTSGDYSGDTSGDYSGDYSGDWDDDYPGEINRAHYYYPLIIPAVIIVLLNTFFIFLVFSNPKLRRNCNALLVSLAVADDATGLIGIPLFLVAALADLGEKSVKALCFVVLSTNTWFWFMSVCSISHLLVIALEQYLAILKPFNHAKIATKPSVTLTLAVIWAISIGHAFIPWAWILSLGDEFCWMEVTDESLQRNEKIFTIVSGTVFFFIPVSVIMYVYFRIVMEAKSHISRIKRDNSVSLRPERPKLTPCMRFRGFYIIALMWLVFILCWAPYFITVFMVTINKKKLPIGLDYKITVLRFLPYILNPLIFMFW